MFILITGNDKLRRRWITKFSKRLYLENNGPNSTISFVIHQPKHAHLFRELYEFYSNNNADTDLYLISTDDFNHNAISAIKYSHQIRKEAFKENTLTCIIFHNYFEINTIGLLDSESILTIFSVEQDPNVKIGKEVMVDFEGLSSIFNNDLKDLLPSVLDGCFDFNLHFTYGDCIVNGFALVNNKVMSNGIMENKGKNATNNKGKNRNRKKDSNKSKKGNESKNNLITDITDIIEEKKQTRQICEAILPICNIHCDFGCSMCTKDVSKQVDLCSQLDTNIVDIIMTYIFYVGKCTSKEVGKYIGMKLMENAIVKNALSLL